MIHILVAEDDLASQRMLLKTLDKWGYTARGLSDGRNALRALLDADGIPKLAIIDWMMPEIDGPDVCRLLRNTPGAPFSYIILLSSRDKKDDIVGGLDAGADDYLVKPYDPAELRSRIRAGERILGLQLALRQANDQLALIAATDALTGIMNRRALIERLDETLVQAFRERRPVAIIMADVDHFKAVNDTYGHPVGDETLRGIASRLRARLRAYDLLGRYGGEEFLLVLPGVPEEFIRSVAERLRRAVEVVPFNAGGKELTVTISLGVAWLVPEAEYDRDAIVDTADRMLYEAKRSGRNCVAITICRNEGLDDQAERRANRSEGDCRSSGR